MEFTKYSKIYFSIALIFVLTSIGFLIAFGLNLGMDFQGGSSLEVQFSEERPSVEEIGNNLSFIENKKIQPIGEKGVLIKINDKDISSDTFDEIITSLESIGPIEENSEGFETISPMVGGELKQKTIWVSFVALLSMLAYIALAFRKVSRPVTSFQYGLVSTLMLFHDILIPLGALAVMGYFWGVELTIPVVTALLAVIGYSINNSVVVFDRIRENLLQSRASDYEEVVNKSLNQIFIRCINTSLTTLFVLTALYYFFMGEESLSYFTLTASIGIIAGTFSSIFLASPILVYWVKKRK